MLALLEQLNDEFGKTIVMVTHDRARPSTRTPSVHLDKGELSEGADLLERSLR